MNIENILKKTGISDIFVEYIQKNEKFKIEFIKFAPSIESDITSLSVNVNCSCKSIVANYIDKNYQECLTFFKRFFEKDNDIKFLNKIIEKIENERLSKYIGGKIAKTSISDWKEFSDKILSSESEFRGFSVVKEGEDIFVFFL